MKEYVLTSKFFAGQLVFAYNDDEILIKFENNAEMSETQINYLMRNFPVRFGLMNSILSPASKLQEIIDVSFSRFWDTYGKKVNKKRSEQLWNKLSDANKQLCLSRLQAYKNYCKLSSRMLKDPDTYLRNKSWEDELY